MAEGNTFDRAVVRGLAVDEAWSIKQGANPSHPKAAHQPVSIVIPNTSLACGGAHPGHPRQPRTFSNLPAEIRNTIWHAALIPRVIILKPKDPSMAIDYSRKVDFSTIPGILYASRESRRIAKCHYDQKFHLTFTKEMPTRTGESISGRVCRVPVIMSSVDELAFSISEIEPQVEGSISMKVSIDVAAGSRPPHIERFSLLGDRLMRQGINAELLARLLNPVSPEWKSVLPDSGLYTRFIHWRPFCNCPRMGLSLQHSDDVEALCVQFEIVDDGFTHDNFLGSSCGPEWGLINQICDVKDHMDGLGLDAYVLGTDPSGAF